MGIAIRKLAVSIGVSVDGFINSPGGEFIAPNWSSDLDRWTARMIDRFDTLVYGCTSWEEMSEYWPTVVDDGALPEPTRQLAHFMNSSRKIVFSRTLQYAAAWANSEVTAEPVTDVVARERSQSGDDMVVFAGANMAQSAFRAGCVDEIWLLTLPYLFGHGVRLFEEHILRSRLELREVKRLDTGAVFSRYEINRETSG